MKRMSRARRLAESVFSFFRRPPQNAIEVTYTERFPKGRCTVAILVPIAEFTLGQVAKILAADWGTESPAIINGRRKQTLRILWQERDIDPKDKKALRAAVEKRKKWAEEVFKLQAYVTPIWGLLLARLRLRAPSL